MVTLPLLRCQKSRKSTNRILTKLGKLTPCLKSWVSAAKTDPYKAFCTACRKKLVAGLSELKQHAVTQRNIRKVSGLCLKLLLFLRCYLKIVLLSFAIIIPSHKINYY